ncbi:AAA family ATPase [Heyndrickxia coagulans]|uniref:AAA family ATPase n=1 Tax=Heyndrickxia coagulans TaxID=1398 RepID=UPI001EEEF321|nr:AAA family ATPase [Heyndrickxia coagulans]
MNETLRNEVAAFRFGLIAPIVQRQLKQGERYTLLREIASQRYTIPGSERTTVSIRSLERYLQAYEENGFEGLKPQERKSQGSLRNQDPEVLKRAIDLRKELPSRSVEQVIRILELKKRAPVGAIKPRTLSRYFQEMGWSKRDIYSKVRKEFRQFEHDLPNDCWQADTQHTLYLPDPKNPEKRKKAYLIAIIDDHSRRIMHAEFFLEERYPRLERCVQKAVLKFGVPNLFFCDNGSVYSAKQFQIMCARMGTKLIHAKPYSPESKGKIEKFFQFVDSSFTEEANLLINQEKLTTLKQLNEYLRSWLEAYDNRIHRSTKQTPKKRYEAKEDHTRHLPAELLKNIFLWEEERTVRKTAIRSLVHHLDPIHYHYLYICDSSLTPKLFYREVLQNFGIQPAFRSNDVKRQYQSLMLDIYENEKKQIVIVLDEAHHFSDSMLQELRFILNFREDSMSPLSLIVAGQPSLRNLLKVKHLEAIDQRIQMRCQMSSLTERETADYIGHQLRVVETPHEIFSEEAIQAIYNFSQGVVPRKVNTLCSQSLLDAFIQGNKVVGKSHIHRVINEL